MTTTAAPRSTRAATSKAAAIPALLPTVTGDMPNGLFWAVHAVNESLKLEAVHQALSKIINTRTPHVLNEGLSQAASALRRERNNSYLQARENGALLLAWYGSKALVQPLPASLKGGAA